MWSHWLLMVAATAVLAVAASRLVESAARLASKLNVSELVIGLTVVAFGTSSPEFAVSLLSTLGGQGDIAVGNVVGSNVFNLGFILGGCALLRPIPTSRALIQRDGLLLAAAALLLLILVGGDLHLGRGEGLLMFLLLVAYLAWMFQWRHTGGVPGPETPREETRVTVAEWGSLLLSLAGIVLGAQVLIGSAAEVARGMGISDWTIGVTVIAAGTSVPELATSVAAVLKRNHTLGVGALIGSDLFNILGVLGVAGLLRPISVDIASRGSLAAMVAMVLLVLVFLRTGWRLSRLEGLLLIAVAGLRWWVDLSSHGMGP